MCQLELDNYERSCIYTDGQIRVWRIRVTDEGDFIDQHLDIAGVFASNARGRSSDVKSVVDSDIWSPDPSSPFFLVAR